MKIVVVYSAKGGVGKSTVTAGLANACSKENKVMIVDADFATPSMHNFIFNKDIEVMSMGGKDSFVLPSASLFKQYMNKAKENIKNKKPDIVIIDTPPSITELHLELFKLKISGVLMVTTPTQLSAIDIKRTMCFFVNNNVSIFGMLVNMVGDMLGKNMKGGSEINIPVLGKIPFLHSIVDNIPGAKYFTNTVKHIKTLKKVNIDLVREQRAFLRSEATIEDAKRWFSEAPNKLEYYNIRTYPYVLSRLQDMVEIDMARDAFWDYNTVEKVTRLVKAFDYTKVARFRVTRNPMTEIPLIPSETGECRLSFDRHRRNIPCVKYSTEHGEVTLFAHEVMPVDENDIALDLQEGFISAGSNRLIPNKETARALKYAYGIRIGMGEDWEDIYDSVIAGGKA